MVLIIMLNVLAILAASILFFLAKAGIKHYYDLFQNEKDVKKLNAFTVGAFIILIICLLLTCTLIITENGYNIVNNKGINYGIQR